MRGKSSEDTVGEYTTFVALVCNTFANGIRRHAKAENAVQTEF